VATDATTQSWQRDFAGQVAKYTDELNRTTTNTYQYGTSKGDLTNTTRPDGTSVNYTYEQTFHFVTGIQDSLNRRTTFREKQRGRE